MEDKSFPQDFVAETRTSRREYKTTDEWLAPLTREIEKLEQILDENARVNAELFGLPLPDQPASASKRRR
jgi:hypothetical protein